MKKIFLIFLIFSSIFLTSCAKKKEVKVQSDKDKIFYSVGYLYGQNFKRFNFSEEDKGVLIEGVQNALMGKKSQVKDLRKNASKIRGIIQKKLIVETKSEKEKGKKFLTNFVKSENGLKSSSGLAYKIMKAGEGKKPKPSDTVKAHYKGTLINGEVFDSSYKRGRALEFKLDKVVKGWTEGMQLIGKGGKVKLVIPSDLGYGDQGAPPKIPPGATLIFEIELVDITENKSPPPKKRKILRKKKK